MPKKRFSAEQVVTLLRQIEVLIAQGKSAPVACREAGISQQSYYRADASLELGAGAKVLIGGSHRSVALQPLSVSGQVGVNLALGVAGLTLRSVP